MDTVTDLYGTIARKRKKVTSTFRWSLWSTTLWLRLGQVYLITWSLLAFHGAVLLATVSTAGFIQAWLVSTRDTVWFTTVVNHSTQCSGTWIMKIPFSKYFGSLSFIFSHVLPTSFCWKWLSSSRSQKLLITALLEKGIWFDTTLYCITLAFGTNAT